MVPPAASMFNTSSVTQFIRFRLWFSQLVLHTNSFLLVKDEVFGAKASISDFGTASDVTASSERMGDFAQTSLAWVTHSCEEMGR